MKTSTVERTDIACVMETVRSGRAAAEKRQEAIRRDIEEQTRRLASHEVVKQVGGKKYERTLGEFLSARSELDEVEASMAKWKWATRLPLGPAIVNRTAGKRHSSVRRALAEASERLSAIEDRVRTLVSRKARLAAVSMHLEEMEALTRAVERMDGILVRLQEMKEEGVTDLAIEAPSRSGSGWYRKLSEIVATREAVSVSASLPAASPIADGGDHSHLDLSHRSKVIGVPYSGRSKEESPWLAMAQDRRPFLADPNRLPGGLAGYRLLTSSWPQSLYGPRRRSGIPKLPGCYIRDDRVYLPVGLTDVAAVTAAGATMTNRNAFHFDPSAVSIDGPLAPWLPFIAQRWFKPLPVELIPRTSWGASLANLLTKSSWNEIRARVIERYDGCCQICGEAKPGQPVECHEIWQYDENLRYGEMAVQKLVGLFSVCKPCHGVFHQGFSRMRGHGDQAGYRLADINGWTMAELEAAEVRMASDYGRRSKLKWALDLTLVSQGKALVVDKGKWRDGGYGILHCDANSSVTAILGASYRIGARGDQTVAVTPPTG